MSDEPKSEKIESEEIPKNEESESQINMVDMLLEVKS